MVEATEHTKQRLTEVLQGLDLGQLGVVGIPGKWQEGRQGHYQGGWDCTRECKATIQWHYQVMWCSTRSCGVVPGHVV